MQLQSNATSEHTQVAAHACAARGRGGAWRRCRQHAAAWPRRRQACVMCDRSIVPGCRGARHAARMVGCIHIRTPMDTRACVHMPPAPSHAATACGQACSPTANRAANSQQNVSASPVTRSQVKSRRRCGALAAHAGRREKEKKNVASLSKATRLPDSNAAHTRRRPRPAQLTHTAHHTHRRLPSLA